MLWLRWIARITSVLGILFTILIASGVKTITPDILGQLGVMLGCVLGLLAAWRWESVGSFVTFVFLIIGCKYYGRLEMFLEFVVMPYGVPTVLFAISALQRALQRWYADS